MDENSLYNLVKELNIAKNHILREEAELIILNELSNHNLGTQVIFYGGTALRLVYNSPRFSEDIDLLQIKPINFKEFTDWLRQLIKKQTNWHLADIKNKRQTIFALIKIKDHKLKHNFSIKIEIHKTVKKIKMQPRLCLITSPTSILRPLLLVPSLVNLENLKIKALLDRQKARDIFDLWFISQIKRTSFVLPNKMPNYKYREFINELQVFLPKKFHSIIKQLYDQINSQN